MSLFSFKKFSAVFIGILAIACGLFMLIGAVFARPENQLSIMENERNWKNIQGTLCESQKAVAEVEMDREGRGLMVPADSVCDFHESSIVGVKRSVSAPKKSPQFFTSSPVVLPKVSTPPFTPPISMPKSKKGSFDLDKLAKAVSVAETSGCSKGSALSHRNCFGIMEWDARGRRFLKTFKTQQASFAEFKRIWGTYYKKFPNQTLANIWVNGDAHLTTDGSKQWLSTVLQSYKSS